MFCVGVLKHLGLLTDLNYFLITGQQTHHLCLPASGWVLGALSSLLRTSTHAPVSSPLRPLSHQHPAPLLHACTFSYILAGGGGHFFEVALFFDIEPWPRKDAFM